MKPNDAVKRYIRKFFIRMKSNVALQGINCVFAYSSNNKTVEKRIANPVGLAV